MSPVWAGDHAVASSTVRGFADSAGQAKQRENEGATGEERRALGKERIAQRSGYLSAQRLSLLLPPRQ